MANSRCIYLQGLVSKLNTLCRKWYDCSSLEIWSKKIGCQIFVFLEIFLRNIIVRTFEELFSFLIFWNCSSKSACISLCGPLNLLHYLYRRCRTWRITWIKCDEVSIFYMKFSVKSKANQCFSLRQQGIIMILNNRNSF